MRLAAKQGRAGFGPGPSADPALPPGRPSLSPVTTMADSKTKADAQAATAAPNYQLYRRSSSVDPLRAGSLTRRGTMLTPAPVSPLHPPLAVCVAAGSGTRWSRAWTS